MTDRSYRYGDPLNVLISEEARTCKGCIHIIKTVFSGSKPPQVFEHCGMRRPFGKKCKHYVERGS